jgi:chromosome segregation ATPase
LKKSPATTQALDARLEAAATRSGQLQAELADARREHAAEQARLQTELAAAQAAVQRANDEAANLAVELTKVQRAAEHASTEAATMRGLLRRIKPKRLLPAHRRALGKV